MFSADRRDDRASRGGRGDVAGRIDAGRRFHHRPRDGDANGTDGGLGHPAGRKAPRLDDGAASQDERDEGDELEASRSGLDSLKIRLALEREAGSIEQRLIGARPKRVAQGDEQDGGQQSGDTFAEPAEHHGRGLGERSRNQTDAMSKPIGKPARGNLERRDREIAGREKGGDDRHGDVLLLYPPEQVQAVHDAFDRDDVVDGVEREVSAKTGSIRGHVRDCIVFSSKQARFDRLANGTVLRFA